MGRRDVVDIGPERQRHGERDSLTQLPHRKKKRKKQKTLEADSCILSHNLPCINNAHHTWQPLPTGKGGGGLTVKPSVDLERLFQGPGGEEAGCF